MKEIHEILIRKFLNKTSWWEACAAARITNPCWTQQAHLSHLRIIRICFRCSVTPMKMNVKSIMLVFTTTEEPQPGLASPQAATFLCWKITYPTIKPEEAPKNQISEEVWRYARAYPMVQNASLSWKWTKNTN